MRWSDKWFYFGNSVLEIVHENSQFSRAYKITKVCEAVCMLLCARTRS